jgi:hypothetical protein
MARLLTQAQFARKTKYSRARITQLVKQGVIILKNGKVDPAQAEAAIEANIDRSRRLKAENKSKTDRSPQMELLPNGFNNGPKNGIVKNEFNADPSPPSLTDTRRDHEILKMKLTEVQLKTKKGQLVPKGEATKMIVAMGSAIKLAFLNLPRRLADILATMTEPKEIEIVLRSEIKNIIHILEQSHGAKHKRVRRKNPKRGLADHLETSG